MKEYGSAPFNLIDLMNGLRIQFQLQKSQIRFELCFCCPAQINKKMSNSKSLAYEINTLKIYEFNESMFHLMVLQMKT